jgi:hypothetical protein
MNVGQGPLDPGQPDRGTATLRFESAASLADPRRPIADESVTSQNRTKADTPTDQMPTLPAEEFSLPWPWTVFVIAVQLPFVAMVLMVWSLVPLGVALVLLVLSALYAWLPLWGTHVSVGSDGINVYRSTYKVQWSDVMSAGLRTFLGHRYLRLQRARGMAVWIPLFLVGRRKIEEALLDWAPKGNPIAQCVIALV